MVTGNEALAFADTYSNVAGQLPTGSDELDTVLDAMCALADEVRRLRACSVVPSAALSAFIAAAERHHPTGIDDVLPWDCHDGNCDHTDECPTVSLVVCDACYALALAIDPDAIPDEVLAARCALCTAFVAYSTLQAAEHDAPAAGVLIGEDGP